MNQYPQIKELLYFFLQSNNQNKLILTHQGILPIIPQSSDSTIDETILDTNIKLRVRVIDNYLYGFSDYLLCLQDTISKQEIQIPLTREQSKKVQEQMDTHSKLQMELQGDYNKLKEEYTFLEYNYQKYLQNLENRNLLKDNLKLLKGITQYTLKLMDDKQQYQNKYQDLQELLLQQSEQVQTKITEIKKKQEEKLAFQQLLAQVQEQQSQFIQNKKQINQKYQQRPINQNEEQVQELQIQKPLLTLILQISNKEHFIQKPGRTNYNQFIQEIQQEYFPEIKQNKSILDYFKNSIIEDTSICQNKQNLSEFQSELANYLKGLQKIKRKQESQLSEYQEQIKNNQEQITMQKSNFIKLEIEYKKLRENYKFIESIYHMIIKIKEQNILIKDNSDYIKKFNKYTLYLVNETEEIKVKNTEIYDKLFIFKKEIESQISELQKLTDEILTLKSEIEQFSSEQQQQQQQQQYQQQQQQQYQQQYQLKQQLLLQQQPKNSSQNQQVISKNNISDENPDLQQESQQLQITKTNIDIEKLSSTQQSQNELRYSNQNTSELKTQLSKCSYCNLSCSKYILLPCLHSFHEDCLEMLGKKAVAAQQSDVKCTCSKKISIKLFIKNTQTILLALQAAQIFTKHQKPFQLRKCVNCEFFCQKNDTEISYCPNCLKFQEIL